MPAPAGSPHANWAEHFKAAMVESLAELGVEFDGISQTRMYTSGAYREQILHAMKHRHDIDAILDRYRTKDKTTGQPKAKAQKQQQKPVDEAELAAAEGSGAAGEDDGSGGSAGYFPYKPYCGRCERDLTTVTSYDDETTELTYTCVCGHSETVHLREFDRGKLVWKVDWPMRWAYEGVIFEPSGVDHSSPGSSSSWAARSSARSSTACSPSAPCMRLRRHLRHGQDVVLEGRVPTPADALKIMEAPLLRWLYARRKPNQSFKVAFDQEIQRLYDEWDKLEAKVADGTALPADAAAHSRAVRTAAGELPLHTAPAAVPHPRLRRRHHRGPRRADPAHPQRTRPGRPSLASLDEVRPRLDRAENWITTQVPADARTIVREEPDTELAALARRRGPRVAAAAPGGPGHALVAGRAHHARLRRAEGHGRARPRGQADARTEDGPARVLRAALPAARQPRDRPASADPAARRRRRPRPQAARRLTAGSAPVRGPARAV